MAVSTIVCKPARCNSRQEIGDFFSVDSGKIPQLDDVYAALASFALRNLRLIDVQTLCHLDLSEAGAQPRFLQTFSENPIVVRVAITSQKFPCPDQS